ncbi:hypothetical protein PENTCL1PPCAC_24324, partial [Pristionchus entomophagus]
MRVEYGTLNQSYKMNLIDVHVIVLEGTHQRGRNCRILVHLMEGEVDLGDGEVRHIQNDCRTSQLILECAIIRDLTHSRPSEVEDVEGASHAKTDTFASILHFLLGTSDVSDLEDGSGWKDDRALVLGGH